MGKDATFSASDATNFTTDSKTITPDLSDWTMKGALQGGLKQALEAGSKAFTNNGTLPKCDIFSDDKADALACNSKNKNEIVEALQQAALREKLNHLDMPKINLEKVTEMLENERNAAKAADIVLNSDPHGRDLGNEAEQGELQRMFHDAHDKGPEAVQRLVDSINKKLEGSGMTVDFDYDHEPFSLNDGKLEVISANNQIIKSLTIPDTDSIYRKGLN